MELVCPAGNLPSLKAAIENGADAVYVGFRDDTNARHFAGLNFSDRTFHRGLEYVHRHGGKLFVAVNTYPRPGNFERWQAAVDQAAEAGVETADVLICCGGGGLTSGIALALEDFDEISSVTPLMAKVYPNGLADVNHFHAAGGLGYMIGELLDAGLLHPDTRTVAGEGLARYAEEPKLVDGRLTWEPGEKTSRNDRILRPAVRVGRKGEGAFHDVTWDEALSLVAEKLAAHRGEDAFVTRATGNVYFWYYASLALFRVGGPEWERWNTALKETLLPAQEENGSWRPLDVYARYAGDDDAALERLERLLGEPDLPRDLVE